MKYQKNILMNFLFIMIEKFQLINKKYKIKVLDIQLIIFFVQKQKREKQKLF